MAVVAVWKCDRDGAMFDNKKEAEEHDKMLELAANITCLIEQHVKIDEKDSEAIGMLLAQRRDKLAIACKGKPDALLADPEAEKNPDKKTGEKADPKQTQNNVTNLSATA